MKIFNHIQLFDERRDLVIPGDQNETLQFCLEHFLAAGNDAIKERGIFTVALSGGNTPKELYKRLASQENRSRLDWKKVLVFWSDERCVPLNHTDSNFHMAMENGLALLNIPKEHIFPMYTSEDPELSAQAYEQQIMINVPNNTFDLIMLGMGDDGHTASLFPNTHGLHPNDHLVIANFIPKLNSWRITMTFDCINACLQPVLYVLGNSKAKMVKQILAGPPNPDLYPSQRIGTPQHKALWILDTAASHELI